MNSLAYEIRVKELSRMSKNALAHIWWLHNRGSVVYLANPMVQTWNKDELVNEILRAEFPNGSAVSA